MNRVGVHFLFKFDLKFSLSGTEHENRLQMGLCPHPPACGDLKIVKILKLKCTLIFFQQESMPRLAKNFTL